MSHLASMQTLTRTSQSRRKADLLLAFVAPRLEPCIPPSTPSPKDRSFAWKYAEASTGSFGAVHPQPALIAGPTASERRGSSVVWLRRHPYIDALQTSVSIERHLSRIFPAHPRSLASVLIPRPAARRDSAFSAFRKSFRLLPATSAERKDFPNLPKMRRLALGAGHLASLRARVSRGQSGQIQTGEKRWNSTQTT